MKKKIMIAASIFLTLVFFLYIVFKVNWSKFLVIITDVNVLILVTAAFVYLFTYIMRAVRLKVLLVDQTITLRQLLGINFIHNFYNRIMPARLGDFTLIFLLNKFSKNTVNSSVNIFIFVKLYDLLSSIFLLAMSYTVIYRFNLLSAVLWLITGLILAISLKPSVILRYVRIITNRYSRWRFIKKLDKEILSLISNSKQVETNRLRLYLFITSLVIWILIFVLFLLLLLSINKSFGFWNTLFATTLANFSWVLPINGIGGFGTMEASMAFAFSLRGYSFHELLLYAFYINVVILILSTLFAIIPYIMILRKGKKDEINHSNTVS